MSPDSHPVNDTALEAVPVILIVAVPPLHVPPLHDCPIREGEIGPTICDPVAAHTMFNSASWLAVVSSLLENEAEIEDPLLGFSRMPLFATPFSQSCTAEVMSIMTYWFLELGGPG